MPPRISGDKSSRALTAKWSWDTDSQTSMKMVLMALRLYHPNAPKIGRVGGPGCGSAPAYGSVELV